MARHCLAGVATCILATGSLVAQVPAHATALNPTTFQWLPTFVQRGDFVHAFAMNPTTLFHARSADGGRTWPLREQSLGLFATHTTGFELPEIEVHTATHVGAMLVLGHDQNYGPQVVRSVDDGATWTAPMPLASLVVAQQTVMRPGLYTDGATVVVAWTNSRPTGRVFCNRSTDFGVTWQPSDTRLDVGMQLGPSTGRLVVLGSGPIVHVLWVDGGTRIQRSLDGGATWLPAVGSMTGVPLNVLGEVASNGGVLLARLGYEAVRSTDAGNTWSLVTNHGVQQVQTLAMQGNLAVVTGVNTVTFYPTYFVNTSTDGGATWRPVPLQLPSAAGNAIFPHAYVEGGAVYVNWEVVGFPGNVIRSDDGGATWQVLDGPVQAGFSPGPVRTIHTARISGGGAFVYHAYVGVGSTVLGAPTAGSGGIAPRLSTVGLPVRGRSTTLQVDAAVGGSVGALGVSFAAPAAIPFGSAIVHLSTLDVLLAYLTGGASGQPGAGSYGLPIAIPNSPVLVGARLVAQGLVVDVGAVDGFAVTNALELWLR